MSLGETIKTYREARGLSQIDLARRAKISQGTLSRIEANLQKPGATILVRVAQILETSVDDLVKLVETSEISTLELTRLPSTFLAELEQLEPQLTLLQQKMVLKIAQALALETATKNKTYVENE